MKKEFLPYDLEVKLVELGFCEKTFDVHSDGWTQGFKVVKNQHQEFYFNKHSDSLERSICYLEKYTYLKIFGILILKI